MKRRILCLIAGLVISGQLLWAQGGDPVLFTVDGNEVKLSEFNYIYTKTNGNKADYSRPSLEEYLDLYVKFKLKVRKAKDMQLDTIPSLQQELEGYHRQLANSYLIDKEVTEKLTQEVYERSKKDIAISHILFLVDPKLSKEEVDRIYDKAARIKKSIEDGASFDTMAQSFSADNSTKGKGGKVGFVTTMLPNGFYELENAIYTTRINELAGPVRTTAGFHIIRVDDARPARGQIEVAHILARINDKTPSEFARAKINNVAQQLQEGKSFEELARTMSEDKATSAKGGYLGIFGINRYEKAFEDAAFALQHDGDYSEPVKSSAGWHIIKRISKPELGPYEMAQARIQARIKQDSRYEEAQLAMIKAIQEEGALRENKEALSAFATSLDKEFATHRWRPVTRSTDEVLFSIGEEDIMVSDFKDFLRRSSRDRMTMGREMEPEAVATQMYEHFLNEQTLKYGERQLENKYPEFKSLMREYEEGILLFEATKILVWDKASQDSAGLAQFYQTQKDKYMWEERARVSHYSLSAEGKDLLPKLKKRVRKKSPAKVLKKINKNKVVLSHTESLYEKGKNEMVDQLPWKAGATSEVEIDTKDKSMDFMKIESIVAPTPKSLKEARGYVVADYQDYLEKKWLEELRSIYQVVINDAVFENLIK